MGKVVSSFHNEPLFNKAMILDTSPISFAIVGPKGRHRGILVRSSLPCLDLVGLEHVDPKTSTANTSLISLFGSPRAFSLVRSASVVPADLLTEKGTEKGSTRDHRRSNLNFAWRGMASEEDLKQISETFTLITADLARALQENEASEVEWYIAPLITMCVASNLRWSSRVIFRRIVYLVVGSIYILFSLALAVKFLPIKL
jgi:hypothetical protein